MPSIPEPVQQFLNRYPDVEKTHMEMSLAVSRNGPLDERQRRLVRLGIAIGSRAEGGVKANARRALDEGFTPDELRHAALLSLPAAGFSVTVAALQWVEDVLTEAQE